MSLPTIGLGIDGWTLRAWSESDAPALAEHADNANVWRNMSDRFPHPYTLAIAEHWVCRGHIEFGGDNWAITLEDRAVGGCGIAQGVAQHHCNAEIGYWLAEPFWGRGVATRVARVLVERALANPEITRVLAPIHADNAASMRVAEKAGLVRESVQPQSAIKAGRAIDCVVYARYREPPP